MVRIPDRAPMNAPRTPIARGPGVVVGDLGLSSVAEALGRTGRGLQTAADRRAAEAFDAADADHAAEYLPAAHAYDGRTPGFARDQMATYDARTAERAEAFGGDADGRRAFERLRPQRRTAQFEAALRVESQRSEERRAEAADRSTRLDALNRTAGLRVRYAQRKREVLDGYDGSTPGLADNALAVLDEEIARAVEDAPETTREALALQLAALRGDEWMSLQTVEGRAREVHDATTATRAADTLVAAVVSDPTQYEAAVRDAQALGGEMPVVLQRQLIEETTRAITVARFEGQLTAGGWAAAIEELESGAFDGALGAAAKASLLDTAGRHRTAAGFDPVSVQRELAAQSLEERVRSETASLASTGQSTGLTAAEIERVGGPVAAAAFTRQAANARLVHSVTRGLAALPPAEQNARLESLRPRGGEPDFAERQAAYELATQTLTTARTLQATDPALAVQSSEESAALWRAYAGERTPAAARTWARDTLRRQAAMGVPPGQRRILPVAEARRVAGSVRSATGPDMLTSLQAASALVGQFGGDEGAVLTELTRAGLDPADAAIIGQAGDNPVALQDYARARARGNVGLTPTVRRDVRGEVVDRLGPLVATWAPLPGGQAGADALVTGITTVASAHVADGMTPRQAAETATQTYLSSYRFHEGWRMPARLGGGNRPVAQPSPAERMGNQIRAQGGVNPIGRTAMAPPEALSLGAFRTVTDVVGRNGAGLYAAGQEPHLTDEQKRARMADRVATSGRWISTLDDGGLMLVVPDPRNPRAVMPVLGADGQPVRRSWDQLFTRAQRPGRSGVR